MTFQVATKNASAPIVTKSGYEDIDVSHVSQKHFDDKQENWNPKK